MNNGLNANIPLDTPLYFSGVVVPFPTPAIDMINFNDPCVQVEAGYKTATFLSTCGGTVLDEGTDTSTDDSTDDTVTCDCPDYYYPVCGDNGLSYYNECYAECDGITNYTYGLCTNGGEGSTEDSTTDDSTVDSTGTDSTTDNTADGTADDSATDNSSTDGTTDDGTTEGTTDDSTDDGTTPPCVDEIQQMCTGHMEPITICPDYCGFSATDSYSLTTTHSTYSCSIYQLDDHCVRYVPLPGFLWCRCTRVNCLYEQ